MTGPRLAEQDSNSIIEQQLDLRLTTIESETDADALTFVGPIIEPMHDILRGAIEDMGHRRNKVVVILETTGGYMESAERIARVFRHNYRQVEFIVPGFAMSAGTILVMSGDAIRMDYSSVLGPIDPQVPSPGGGEFVPALGYIEMFDRLIAKSADPNSDLTTAELTYLVQNFNPAELYRYEQERELSVELLKEWLVKFKFRNWKVTEGRGEKVTKQMRSDRAEEIARQLNKTQLWHSHSRGIPMERLIRDLNLKIDDFGADPILGPAVRQYYRLLKDYMLRRNHEIVWHTKGRHNGF